MKPETAYPGGVLFDMDGLLFDSERPAIPLIMALSREMGTPVSEDVIRRTIGCNAVLSRKIYAESVPDLDYAGYREVGDFREAGYFDTPKILLAAEPARIPVIQSRLEALYGCRAYFAQSESHLVEVMNKGCDKGSALRRLREILGLKKEEVMGCGDNTNDLPLLLESGTAVAVANSVPELKAAATYVCEGERSDGFNEAVKKFVLEE